MAIVNVIVIHGMGLRMDDSTRYSQTLEANIRTHFGKLDQQTNPQPVNPNDQTILKFWPVNYSDIGDDEQTHLIKAHHILPDPRKTSIGGMWSVRHWLGEQIDRWYGVIHTQLANLLQAAQKTQLYKPYAASNELRTFLVTHIGDVLVYQTAAGGAAMRKKLCDTIEAVRDHVLQYDAQHERHYVSIVAYSLGSIITYDVCRQLGEREPQKVAGLRLANLFTLGSPLALFSLQSYGGEQPHYADRGVYLNRPDGAWLNFYDQQDPLAFPLRHVYPRIPKAPTPVVSATDTRGPDATRDYDIQDIRVQTGTIRAHTGYFGNAAIAQTIAAQLHKQYLTDR